MAPARPDVPDPRRGEGVARRGTRNAPDDPPVPGAQHQDAGGVPGPLAGQGHVRKPWPRRATGKQPLMFKPVWASTLRRSSNCWTSRPESGFAGAGEDAADRRARSLRRSVGAGGRRAVGPHSGQSGGPGAPVAARRGTEITPPTVQHARALLRSAESHRLYALWTFLALTGARKGEASVVRPGRPWVGSPGHREGGRGVGAPHGVHRNAAGSRAQRSR
jgi:hypothetical protein